MLSRLLARCGRQECAQSPVTAACSRPRRSATVTSAVPCTCASPFTACVVSLLRVDKIIRGRINIVSV